MAHQIRPRDQAGASTPPDPPFVRGGNAVGPARLFPPCKRGGSGVCSRRRGRVRGPGNSLSRTPLAKGGQRSAREIRMNAQACQDQLFTAPASPSRKPERTSGSLSRTGPGLADHLERRNAKADGFPPSWILDRILSRIQAGCQYQEVKGSEAPLRGVEGHPGRGRRSSARTAATEGTGRRPSTPPRPRPARTAPPARRRQSGPTTRSTPR